MIDIQELLNIQEDFTAALGKKASIEEYIFALNVEVSEFLNTLPWKWWKNNQTVDKEKTLDELADIIAFWLSACNAHYNRQAKCRVFTKKEFLDIKNKHIEKLSFSLNTAMNTQNKDISVFNVNYFSKYAFTTSEAAGSLLGYLIAVALKYTGATVLEVVHAYKKKMDINWERQTQNY